MAGLLSPYRGKGPAALPSLPRRPARPGGEDPTRGRRTETSLPGEVAAVTEPGPGFPIRRSEPWGKPRACWAYASQRLNHAARGEAPGGQARVRTGLGKPTVPDRRGGSGT